MLSRLGVSEPFGKTKVNHIDIVLLLTNANQEVVRLDVSMKEVATVDKLNSLELQFVRRGRQLTIWSASMSTVLRENLRLQ